MIRGFERTLKKFALALPLFWALLNGLAATAALPAEPQAGPRLSRAAARTLFERSLGDEVAMETNWPIILREAPDSEFALYIEAESVDSFHKQIELYTRALTINPVFVEALVERARAKAELTDWPGALGDINAALKLRPRDFYALLDRGDILQRSGKARDALVDFSTALDLATNHRQRGLALLFRGETRLELGESALAIQDADQALRLEPDNAQVLLLRGRARLTLGLTTAACVDLKKAMELGEMLAEVPFIRYCSGKK